MERTAGGITYTLTRRRVRNINLRVRADGSVAASASPRVPAAYVDAFVTARADWVRTALRTGTLAFARRLCTMPLPAQEYVVVHEFCHFAHPDHSPAFWAAVAEVLPDYKQRERMLKLR